jgi:hypothetical protein
MKPSFVCVNEVSVKKGADSAFEAQREAVQGLLARCRQARGRERDIERLKEETNLDVEVGKIIGGASRKPLTELS